MLKYLAVRNVIISILEMWSYRKNYRRGKTEFGKNLQQIPSHGSYERVESIISFVKYKLEKCVTCLISLGCEINNFI